MVDQARFRFEEDGEVRATGTFQVIAFTGADTRSAAAGIAKVYERFHAAHGRELSHYRTNDESRTRKFDRRAAEMVPFWMSDDAALDQANLGITIHSGKKGDGLEPPSFAFFQSQGRKERSGYVAFHLPMTAVAGFSDVQPLLEALEHYPLRGGWAGYDTLWDEGAYGAKRVRQWLRPLLLRHPGLGGGEALAFMVHGSRGLLNVSWLNLVGPEYLKALGGLKKLQARAKDSGVTVHALGKNKAVLQAGEAPALGDVNRGDALPAYREAGRLLEPVRAPRDEMEQVWLDPLREETADWLERFFVDRQP